jgi:hypothetical protein
MGEMALLGKSTDLTRLNNSSENILEEGDWLTEMARNLYKSFTNSEDECPYIVAKNYVTILSRYPVEIIQKVCDPMSGLPSELKWVAGPKELRECCEKHFAPILRARERDDRLARQMARRREDEAARSAPKTGVVAKYLAGRTAEKLGSPAAAETVLRKYVEERNRYGNTVSLSPDAQAAIEAAGLEIPA